MSDDKQFERRIAALEYAVAELRRRLDKAGIKTTDWLEDFAHAGWDEEMSKAVARDIEERREAERRALEAADSQ